MGLTAAAVSRRADESFDRKINWNDRAQYAAKVCMPHKATITVKKEDGAGVDLDVYDSTAMDDSQIMAAGIQAFLCPQSDQWFGLKLKNQRKKLDSEGQDWLQKTTEDLLGILSDSNFYSTMGEHLHDLVVLPGATMYGEDDPDDVVNFTSIPFDQVGVELNNKNECDGLHRRYTYTVKQMVDRWGESEDKLGPKVWEMWKAGKWSEKVGILHSVGKRYDRDMMKKDSKNMPYYSCFVDERHKRIIEEKGYKIFPYFVDRWRTIPGQDWGYSPALIALPDIYMINEMARTGLMAGQMSVAPPWLFPDEQYVLPLDFNQFAINYGVPNAGATGTRDWKPFPLVSGSNYQIGVDMMNRYDQKIHAYFQKNLFLPLLEKQVTAFEFSKIIEKSFNILGSSMGNIQRFTLAKVIDFTYKKAMQLPKHRRIIDEPPASVVEAGGMEPRYVSPLAIAQHAAKAQTTESFLFDVSQIMAVYPQARFKVKWGAAIDEIADKKAINPKLLTTEEEFEALVEQDNQAQAQANAMQMAMAGTKALEQAGKANQAMTPKESKK